MKESEEVVSVLFMWTVNTESCSFFESQLYLSSKVNGPNITRSFATPQLGRCRVKDLVVDSLRT